MSQFDQTSSETNNEDRKKSPVIYWVVILLLLIGCAFLFWSNQKTRTEKDQTEKQLDSVKSDRASLQSDFDAASAKIDQLVSLNSKMDSSLQKDKEEIVALQRKIRSLLGNKKASVDEMKKAREMINSLTDKTTQYEARIAELEKENTMLTHKNGMLAKERDSAVTQNIAIKKIASVLHASNMRMVALQIKKNGKEVGTSKAKKADVLRIIFDIDENRIAESGTKQIYLRLLAPDGTMLRSAANSSGMMVTGKGDQLSYSIQKEVALIKEQKVNDISVDWRQDEEYPKGNYLIEVYSEGYKVGSGTVNLK
ncbi:MAG: hypothetical protein H7257_13125 [Taibaiella sp.]|nr:hypothetical protein [Taibaiella sp.]